LALNHNPPISTSQVAEITVVNHHTQLAYILWNTYELTAS
jgi:hypothetical protein